MIHMKRSIESLREKVKQLWVVAPYAWLILFFLVPFFYLISVSLSDRVNGVPPLKPLLHVLAPGEVHLHLNFNYYIQLFSELFYVKGFLSSLVLASMTTFLCLILGYAMAYGILKLPRRLRPLGLMLIMVPFSTSFLIRIYAWIILLNQEGMINTWMITMGVIHEPLSLLYNNASVLIGLVYCYVPFMILPIYTILEKIDQSYLEAAADLGASPLRRFYQITLPLSRPGIIAGCILVFIPVTGEFVIPELLGGPDTLMIGRILWLEFFNNRNWPLAAALAVVMLVIFVVPIMLLQRMQKKDVAL
jgi:putrescine transport system permease protein